jgi:hypothetical protein
MDQDQRHRVHVMPILASENDPASSISHCGADRKKGRPVQYILPDGHLDVSRWEMNNIQRDRG